MKMLQTASRTCLHAPTHQRYNATFGTNYLNHGMLKGAIMDSSVGGCANVIRGKHCDTPSDRWYASAIKGIEQNTVQHAFEDKMAEQLGTLKRLGKFPKKGLGIAIDMHLIPRYDRVPGEELTCSKHKNGTTYLALHDSPVCKRQYAHGSCRIIPEKAGIRARLCGCCSQNHGRDGHQDIWCCLAGSSSQLIQ